MLHQTLSKVITGKALLTGVNTEHFLGKFSIGVGTGRVVADFWVKDIYDNPQELTVYTFCDEDWDSVRSKTTCRDKSELSRRKDLVAFTSKHERMDKVNGVHGKVAQLFSIDMNLTMHIRTHYWYFMLADCTLEEYFHKVPEIYYRVQMFNEPGDNHFPADDIGLPQLYYVNIIIVALNFVFLVYMSVRKAASSGNIHLIVLMLDVAVGISLASNFFEIIHLSFYAYDGIGSALCDTMSALGEAMCDFIVIFMLISISCGWTLSSSLPMDLTSMGFKNRKTAPTQILDYINTKLRKPSQFMQNCNMVSLTLASLFVFHLVLVLWGRMYDDEFYSFHNFEHLPGRILMLFRAVCGILFWFLVTQTMHMQGGVGDMASFLKTFRLFGMTWFWSLPIAVLLAPLWAEYLRHWWISGVVMLGQSLTMGGLTYTIFDSKNSIFYRKSAAGSRDNSLEINKGFKPSITRTKVNVD